MQVCTSLQTDNHASTPPLSFLQAGCTSCRPTNSIKALKKVQGKISKTTPRHLSRVTTIASMIGRVSECACTAIAVG